MKKSVQGSCEDQHDCKDDSRTSKKRSIAASPKRGPPRSTKQEKQQGLGDQSVPVVKRKLEQKSTSPKVDPVYNLRSRVQKTDSPVYNQRNKVRKTEGPNASTVTQKRGTPKTDRPKDSSVATPEMERIPDPKSSAQPVKKNCILFKQFFGDPIYHIRWEGHDTENEPFGQCCILCNKDLSGVTQDDDSEHYPYDDDDNDDGEYDDYDDFMPRLLPAVDILSCGHAFHTECLQNGKSVEQPSEPHCVLCSTTP